MRRHSRELALQVLFQTEFAPAITARDVLLLHEEPADPATVQYAQDLIDGVVLHRQDIDNRISAASRHWKIERMGAVDRNILRMAIFEMKFAANPLKESIAINEAVDLARQYGSTESGAFVNGVLDQVAKGS